MKLTLCLILSIIVSINCFAQYNTKQLSVNEGLSHSDVSCLTQDKSGFIWLGTNNGLNRFNGYDFEIFKNIPNNNKSLVNNRIKSLLCDSKNRIWIATGADALSYYDPFLNIFQNITLDGISPSNIRQMCEDENADIWLFTSSRKLVKLHFLNDELELKNYDLPFDSDISEINTYRSKIWICTKNDGLWILSPENKVWKKISTSLFQVSYSITEKDKTLYIATDKGIFSIESNFDIKSVYQDNLSSVSSMVIDHKDNIWLGIYNGGIQILKPAENGNYQLNEEINATHLLSTNRINELFIDNFDILWIATSGGGMHYIDLRAKPFGLINKNNSNIPDNYVSAIYENEHNYWIGTRNGLLEINKQSGASVIKSKGHISCILMDHAGQLWVGKRFEGLFVYRSNQLIKTYEEEEVLKEIMSIQEDKKGRLWVATYSVGVIIIDTNSKKIVQRLDKNNYLPSNNLSYIYLDPQSDDVAWLGSRDKGLLKVELQEGNRFLVKTYEHKANNDNSLSSNYVWPILRTNKGELWIGTIGGGLNKMIETDSVESFKRYLVHDGLPDNDVESMLEDELGNLWIGGRGFAKFNPVDETFYSYDVKDGLQSNSFKIGAAFKSKDGVFSFGGINGLNHFDPRQITPNPHKPRLVFDKLKIHNKTIQVGENINGRLLLTKSLNYTDELAFLAAENEFTIDLLGLHYSNPKKNIYAYTLEGYTDEWQYHHAKERKITFANLPSGSYNFKAKVSNNDGLWSDVRSIKIYIHPPWWASWWAYLIYSSIVLFGLYLYWLYQKRQTLLKNELIIAENEKQVYDEKMKFFTSISHEIRTPLTLIHGPLDDIIESEANNNSYTEKLMLIRKNVNRLLNLSNQILDFRKMETGNMKLSVTEGNISNFAKEVFLFFQNKVKERNIDYTFQSTPENIQLTYDHHNFEIILTNLLSNAFKYTKKDGAISLRLKAIGSDTEPAIFETTSGSKKLIDNYLEIIVEDNGIGLSSNEIECIFERFYQVKNTDTISIQGSGIGLNLVKGLVDLHCGEINVESVENKGSRFIIHIPFGQAHFKKEIIHKDFKNNHLEASYYNDQLTDIAPKETDNIDTNNLKKRVLIVEDNRQIQGYLNSHLKQKYKVIIASNGAEGVEKARQKLPDIIISDVMMPEMDGLEMLSILKKDVNLAFIPVILLTAKTATINELEGVNSGAHDYITKPFNVKILKGKIENILQSREQFKYFYSSHIKNEASKVTLPNSEQKFIADISNIVLDNLLNPDFSVSALVKEMGMSQSSCYKRIKDLTGRSAIQFIRDIRLKRAGELLKEGKYNVSEVSFMIGMSDLKYFREKFKELFGCPPSEYGNL